MTIDNNTMFLEIERKYEAKKINKDVFLDKLESFKPIKKIKAEGLDVYFKNNERVLRWRDGSGKKELTIKNRLGTNTFSRKEIDLNVFKNSNETIEQFLSSLGYVESFRIYKYCDIYWFSDEFGDVNVVYYKVVKDNQENRFFVEIEAEKGQDYKISKECVNIWEKRLGLKVSQRINKSLYEIYSGESTPILSEKVFCGKCGIIKDLNDFYKRKTGVKQGDVCKICDKKRTLSTQRKEQKKTYRLANKSKISEYNKKYANKNKEKINKRRAALHHKKYNSNHEYKIKLLLRSRLLVLLRSNKSQKKNSTVELLGCSVSQFRKWIESQFYQNPVTGEKMTWGNHGRGKNKWQFDHKIPFVSFNIKDQEQLKKAFNYKNVRPMWGIEHEEKSKKERILGVEKKNVVQLNKEVKENV